ncbi:MAG: biopolymer transporter ExbD [Bacteroidia bacterium]|nr:biopolymer transporter ExbD [Bacteroidia bacterium]
MAEIEGGGGGHHKKGGKPKGKKMSTRVDFTPMVDLGFLLITFFMLTTSMNKAKTMEINMPVKEDIKDPQPIKASQAITLLLAENDKIVYYFINEKSGEPETPVITTFSKTGIRETLLKRNHELLVKANADNYDSIPILKEMYRSNQIPEAEMKSRISGIKANKHALIVVIKADDKAKYKNLVDILDEMLICNIGRYAIVDITPIEKDLIKMAMGVK